MIISIILISLLAIGAVSATEDIVDDDVSSDADNSVNVVSVEDTNQKSNDGTVEKEDIVKDESSADLTDEFDNSVSEIAASSSGASKLGASKPVSSSDDDKLAIPDSDISKLGDKNSNFDFSKIFGGATLNFGDGTSFNLSDLFNNTILSFSNGTSFNLSDLLSNGTLNFGNGSSFNLSSLFNNTTLNVGNWATFNLSELLGNGTLTLGNGSSFNLSSLFNNGTLSFGNGTHFNLSDLFGNGTLSFANGTFSFSNGTFTFNNRTISLGNKTNFDISTLLNKTNIPNFDISSILDMFGFNRYTIEGSDLTKVYSPNTSFKVTVKSGNKILNKGTVIFTVDDEEYVGRIGSNGVAYTNIKYLKPGKHYVFVEYGQTTARYSITVKKAASKITASKKSFKSKTKTKKYTITLKTNLGTVLKDGKVTLRVNGKTYKATTNAKGKATFKITKLTKKGKFKAIVRFAGSTYYKAASKSVKITVKK